MSANVAQNSGFPPGYTPQSNMEAAMAKTLMTVAPIIRPFLPKSPVAKIKDDPVIVGWGRGPKSKTDPFVPTASEMSAPVEEAPQEAASDPLTPAAENYDHLLDWAHANAAHQRYQQVRQSPVPMNYEVQNMARTLGYYQRMYGRDDSWASA